MPSVEEGLRELMTIPLAQRYRPVRDPVVTPWIGDGILISGVLHKIIHLDISKRTTRVYLQHNVIWPLWRWKWNAARNKGQDVKRGADPEFWHNAKLIPRIGDTWRSGDFIIKVMDVREKGPLVKDRVIYEQMQGNQILTGDCNWRQFATLLKNYVRVEGREAT